MTNTTSKLHTPYHELGGANAPFVPSWAKQRSVYRSAGRTLYLVQTDELSTARRDLASLARRGWDVRVDRSGTAASIALSRKAA